MGFHIQGHTLIRYTEEPVITVPDGITEIGDGAFQNCRFAKEIILPESVTMIGRAAFCQCYGLERIRIPDGVTELPDRIFMNCSHLQSVTLPSGLTRIGREAFDHCHMLSELALPECLTEIDAGAFFCAGLGQIRFPEQLRRIGASCFRGTGIPAFTLPPALEHIGLWAFEDEKRIVIPTAYGAVTVYPRTSKERSVSGKSDMEDVYRILTQTDADTGETLFAGLTVFEYKAAAAVYLGQTVRDTASQKWLRRFAKRIAENDIQAGNMQMLSLLLQTESLTKAGLDGAIAYAQQHQQTEPAALLMDCKNRTYGFSGGSPRL